MRSVIIASLLSLPAAALLADEPFRIEEVRTKPDVAITGTAPFIAGTDDSWLSGPALWSGQGNGVSAEFRAATSGTSFLFQVLVKDPKQENPYTEQNLWRGDCIYVGIDARGDDSEEELKAGEFAPDDAVIVFAIGANGPEARVSKCADGSDLRRNPRDFIRQISRDESAQVTRYDLEIPFKSLATALGQSDTFGVALIVAHKDPDGNDLPWGRPQADAKNSRQFSKIKLETGSKPFVSIAPVRTRLPFSEQPAAVMVACRDTAKLTLVAGLGGAKTKKTSAGESGGVQRFLVKASAAAIPSNDAAIAIEIRKGEKTIATEAYPVLTPLILINRFEKHLARLRDAATGNEILLDHLDATRRVVRDAFERLPLEEKSLRERPAEFLKYVELIDSKLPADRYDFTKHVNAGLPLVFAFSSRSDSTLQFYALQFPYGYDPARSYPLTIYLHGSGDSNPLGGLSTAFDNKGQDTLFSLDPIDPANVPPSHRGFVLAPWARGNSYYESYGEEDVWQCMAIVGKRFKIDEDRIYLTGFSMGCHGTMGMAGRRPDVFAGLCLASGFGSWSQASRDYLVENLRGLPIAVWIGELDPMAKAAERFHQMLNSKGFEHRYEVTPMLPHTFPYAKFQENAGYLMKHRRQRSVEFAFTADTHLRTGRNGVNMYVPRFLETSRLPAFRCKVNGQTVSIQSENTPWLLVNAGPDGLGMSGEIVIEWNGEKVYAGPPEIVELGKRPKFFD